MDSQVERIYIGLPEHLKDKVFWVERAKRTNELSHIPGGTDVVMEYHNSQVLGYDWIKDPFNYIRAMDVIQECFIPWGENKYRIRFNLDLFKTKVSGIFIRKYKTENYKIVYFEKVWDSATTNETPFRAIDKFLSSENL